MLVAHAPAGYLLGRVLSRTLLRDTFQPEQKKRLHRYLMTAAVLGGIFPDFDFFYHIVIDSSQTPHHSYFTHMPVFWLATWFMLTGMGMILRNRAFIAVTTAFCLSALLHLALDTLTGVIYWFYPLSARGVNVFKVADVHRWWVENYTHHWTFIIEIIITTTAMAVFLRVRETFADIADLFRRHKNLRALSLRLAACALGIAVIALVGSLKFSIDNRAIAKAAKLKRAVVTIIHSRDSLTVPKPPRVPGPISKLRDKSGAISSGIR